MLVRKEVMVHIICVLYPICVIWLTILGEYNLANNTASEIKKTSR